MDAVNNFSKATVFNVSLQMTFRLSTFVLNAALLRFISKDCLGIVNVRLMLLYSSLVFIVREPFRKACLSTDQDVSVRSRIAVVWLCPLLCIIASCIALPIWIYYLDQPDSTTNVQHYTLTCFLFVLSVFIETLAEPFWILAQIYHLAKIKAVIEGTFMLIRNILFFFLTIILPNSSLSTYGMAMVLSSIVYTLSFHIYFWYYLTKNKSSDTIYFKKWSNVLPSPNIDFDRSLIKLVTSFFSHSFVKQLLTEGEKTIMTFFNILTFADQGIFDVINNLGSLVPRLIFAPVEESSYTLFSSLIQRGIPAVQQKTDDLQVATRILHILLKAVTLAGLLIIAFGVPFSFIALKIYGGDLLITGGGVKLLRWQCVAVLFYAINGITECFAMATMPKSGIDSHRRRLIIFTISHLVISLVLIKIINLSSVGFILANCFSMSLRIIYSCTFIINFYKSTPHQPLLALIPNPKVFILLIVAFLFCVLAAIIFGHDGGLVNYAGQIMIGFILFMFTLSTIWNEEHELSDFIRTQYLSHSKLRSR